MHNQACFTEIQLQLFMLSC